MTQRDAIALIDHPALRAMKPSHWADLGCGAGTFTLALAELLAAGSTIEAIDLRAGIARQMTAGGVTIIPRSADFVRDELGLERLDGILMANSLHYVKDKAALLQKLRAFYRAGGLGMRANGSGAGGLGVAPLDDEGASGAAPSNDAGGSDAGGSDAGSSNAGAAIGAALLLVEYDTDRPTPHWVPYPLSFAAASQLLPAAGWSNIQKLGSRPSAFGRSQLYAVLAQLA